MNKNNIEENTELFSGLIVIPDKSLMDYDMRAAVNYRDKVGRELTKNEFERFRKNKRPSEMVFNEDGKVAFI
ncbi:MAG: SNF2 helicase-associated domain-containing protein [Clostridiales Family XIII bacterium]|jgi:hypothetical protein|nr:SNF2 helicase-associated domain-containing protein [Clostridiales Family XIII bacterium]